MSFAYQKVKSVAKQVEVAGDRLTKLKLDTMKHIADIVGATLGPGGRPVLIERQEENLPPMVTKDGVTVFKHLGLDNPIAHVLMESTRDAAERTANEAGDGTTTATVLAEAIHRLVHEYTAANKHVSPQKIVRVLQSTFDKFIAPRVKEISDEFFRLNLEKPEDQKTYAKMLYNVARISANGESELAAAVMKCFEVVGDDGNVTLTEVSGPSGYEVEEIPGYPVTMGYEDSCLKYSPFFVTDEATQRCVLENPLFVVYHGRITEIQSLAPLMEQIGEAWQSNKGFRHNVVLVATGFSNQVIETLAGNMTVGTTINVFPLLAPLSPVPGGQLGILRDIAAVTGAPLLDPVTAPLDRAKLEWATDEEGNKFVSGGPFGMRAKTFEATRFRSVILTHHDFDAQVVLDQYVDVVKAQAQQAASTLDAAFFQERIGKLQGGLAKLKVIGSSAGDLRERRDRAEDAICAVRGAIKHGVVPGGGWMLLELMRYLLKNACVDPLATEVVQKILVPALKTPFVKIYENLGYTDEEIDGVFKQMYEKDFTTVYDAYEQKLVPMWHSVLDSTPAVREAIKNSLSIAQRIGTLGGAIAFKRDLQLERQEGKETSSFLRDANGGYSENPANERGM